MEEEYFFSCPYCGERISVLIDISVKQQQYIEDCEVCCRPISISYATNEGKISTFAALQQE